MRWKKRRSIDGYVVLMAKVIFKEPTVLENVPSSNVLCCEEAFG